MPVLKNNIDSDVVRDVVKTGTVAITSGLDYVTIHEMDQLYLDEVKEAADSIGITVHHIEAAGCPRTTKALGVGAVPALVQVIDGQVTSAFVGAATAVQLKAFMQTGVPPV